MAEAATTKPTAPCMPIVTEGCSGLCRQAGMDGGRACHSGRSVDVLCRASWVTPS